MKYKTSFLISILNFIVLLVLVIFLSFKFSSSDLPKIVYIDNIKLFNDFNMTKDLNRINGLKVNNQKKKLDSLYTIYGIYRDNKKTEKLEFLEAQLRLEDQNLKEMNERFSNGVSQTVWNRLNTYVSEYGAAKAYKIILGTQGNGNVMYAAEGIDITNELIKYSNTKYEGEQ